MPGLTVSMGVRVWDYVPGSVVGFLPSPPEFLLAVWIYLPKEAEGGTVLNCPSSSSPFVTQLNESHQLGRNVTPIPQALLFIPIITLSFMWAWCLV